MTDDLTTPSLWTLPGQRATPAATVFGAGNTVTASGATVTFIDWTTEQGEADLHIQAWRA